MPQLPAYTAQTDPRGGAPTPTAGPAAFGAEAAQGLARLGDALVRQQAQDENAWVLRTMARFRFDRVQALEKTREQTPLDAPDITPGVLGAFDQAAAAAEDEAPSPRARDMLETALAEFRAAHGRQALEHDAARRTTRRTHDAIESINLGHNTLISDPTQFESILRETTTGIRALDLPGPEKEKLLEAAQAGLAEGAVRGVIELDPTLAEHQLKAGRWDEYLDGKDKTVLLSAARTAIRAREAEAALSKTRADKARKEAQRTEADAMLQRIYEPGNNPLTIHDIMASGLNPTGDMSKETFVGIVRAQEKERHDQTNYPLVNQLFALVEDGRLTDPMGLLPYIGEGLRTEDFQMLRNEIELRKKPEQAAYAAAEKAFFAGMKPQISKSTLFKVDPKGDEQFYKFRVAFMKAKKEWAAAGKNPLDLIDDTNSAYFGRFLSRYKRTPAAQLDDMLEEARSFNRGTTKVVHPPSVSKPSDIAPQRKAGESPEDYLKRIGKE